VFLDARCTSRAHHPERSRKYWPYPRNLVSRKRDAGIGVPPTAHLAGSAGSVLVNNHMIARAYACHTLAYCRNSAGKLVAHDDPCPCRMLRRHVQNMEVGAQMPTAPTSRTTSSSCSTLGHGRSSNTRRPSPLKTAACIVRSMRLSSQVILDFTRVEPVQPSEAQGHSSVPVMLEKIHGDNVVLLRFCQIASRFQWLEKSKIPQHAQGNLMIVIRVAFVHSGRGPKECFSKLFTIATAWSSGWMPSIEDIPSRGFSCGHASRSIGIPVNTRSH